MNLKRINIRYRFIFQIVIFVIYAVLVSCIILLLVNQIRKHRSISQEIEKLHTSTTANHIIYKNLLQNTKTGDLLYREGENAFTEEFRNNIITIRDSISFLLTNSHLGKKTTKLNWLDSVLIFLDDYQTIFNQTTLALQELGDRNTGKIAAVYTNSDQLTALLLASGTPELVDLSLRLKNIQSEYLVSPGITKYNDIMYLLDEINYNPALSESDTLQLDQVRSQIESYKSCIGEMHNLITRLSTIGEVALYTKMEASMVQIDTAFNQLSNSLERIHRNYIRWLILICIALIFLLSVLYLFQFFTFYYTFSKPLQESIDFSYHLSKGKFTDNALNTEVPFEISQLNENLNRITNSLQEKKVFVDSLLKQKFDIDMDLQGKSDTFGKTLIALKENMKKAREEQIKHANDNQIRRYQNEGIAKFADILRNNSDDLNKLSDIFIKEIIRYLEAIQGGLFLLETDNETLKLASAFAYNRKKYLTKSIKKGESLVGTCALEKKTILLTDIPEGYIEITSGLGDTPPNTLLLLPVMHEEQLIGVLEMASLTKFNPNQIELGEKIASSLASTIINARINSQTSELLQKSQQQAAEMAEQEEEMRQNMEELKATQEESARREEELQGILNAIDQSFYMLEYDIEGIITKVNQRFLYLINLPLNKVIGIKHNQLFGKKSKADSLLFANVAEGNTVELNEKVEINKKSLNIKNTFSPVRSKEGNTIKIINIMTVNI